MVKGVLFWTIIKRRSIPALVTFVSVIGGAVVYLAVAPRMYETTTRMILDDKRVSVSDFGRNLNQVSAGNPGGSSPLADQAELVKSQGVLENAIANLKSQPRTSSMASKLTLKKLSRDLKVKIVPATNILELKYKSPNSVFASSLLNAVASAMVEDNIKTTSLEATKVREFLENKEVPSAQKRLQIAEIKENRYRQSSGIVAFEDQTRSLVNSIATLEDQERMLIAQLTEARARDASLRQVTNSSTLEKAVASVRSGQDDQVKNLRGKLTELETQIVALRQRFTPEHPQLSSLMQQRSAVALMYQQELARVSTTGTQAVLPNTIANDTLSQNLNSQLVTNAVEGSAAVNKLRTLQGERASLIAQLAQLPIKQEPLTALTRTRVEAAESFKNLQSKLEEARIAEAQKVSNIRVIEAAAIPTVPSDPQVPVILVLAGALGTLLSLGVVLLLEVMDNRLHDAKEAEELLLVPQVPLLGMLPRLHGANLRLQPADSFLDDMGLVEPYRMLLKTLEYRSPDDLRLIVVSSSLSNEGKSVVVSHLAAVAAMLSRRTLIIDADLRRPTLHRLFDLSATPGLTDAITKRLRLADVVQPTGIEHLSLLTCGAVCARPSQLLESRTMKALMAEASEDYDLVIVDTPPLNACADATTLSQFGNGIMLVTRPSLTIKEILQKAVADLTRDRILLLGVVVNGLTTPSDKYYRDGGDGSQSELSRGLAQLGTLRNSDTR